MSLRNIFRNCVQKTVGLVYLITSVKRLLVVIETRCRWLFNRAVGGCSIAGRYHVFPSGGTWGG